MSTVNPHPALKVAVPFAPMIDGWMGDDWFHNGAFRQLGTLEFTYFQETSRGSGPPWWSGEYDAYDTFLRAGSAGAVAASRGLDQLGFWRKLAAHPAYDEFWQEQAVDKLLAGRPLGVPMLIVAGLFDQEDIYGGPALFRALAPKDPEGRLVHLVLGPWNHGQGRREGRGLGAISFEGDTAGWFRREVMQPLLDHYLKGSPMPGTPRVLAYETGANRWREYDGWPRSCEAAGPRQGHAARLARSGSRERDRASGDRIEFAIESSPGSSIATPSPGHARRAAMARVSPQSAASLGSVATAGVASPSIAGL